MPIYKGKKVARFNFDKNRKSAAKRKRVKNAKKRTMGTIKREEEGVLAKVWDHRRSMTQNLEAFGLSNDANKTIKIEKTRLATTEAPKVERTKSEKEKTVIAELEKVASTWEKKDWTVSQDDIHFCVHMLDEHGQE